MGRQRPLTRERKGSEAMAVYRRILLCSLLIVLPLLALEAIEQPGFWKLAIRAGHSSRGFMLM